MYRYLAIIIYLSLCLFSTAGNSATPPMLVKHTDTGYSPALRPYMKSLLKQALDLTSIEFGPYKIQTTKVDYPEKRAKIETEKGGILNVLFASSWTEDASPPSDVVEYNLPAFNDLLGLRALLVNRNSQLETRISDQNELKLLKAGQGQFWEDVKILAIMVYVLLKHHTIDALYPMLNKGRFDYIPLSVLEAKIALAERTHQFENIHILPNTYIFYSIRFNLYVNKKNDSLAARFKLGLERTTDKLLTGLFKSHFSDLIFNNQTNQEPKKNKLFLAYNPNISNSDNKEITGRFLKNYDNYFTLLE